VAFGHGNPGVATLDRASTAGLVWSYNPLAIDRPSDWPWKGPFEEGTDAFATVDA
jgi:hypothetical protein